MKRLVFILLCLTSCKGCIEVDHSGTVDVYHHVDAEVVIKITDTLAVDVAHDVTERAASMVR